MTEPAAPERIRIVQPWTNRRDAEVYNFHTLRKVPGVFEVRIVLNVDQAVIEVDHEARDLIPPGQQHAVPVLFAELPPDTFVRDGCVCRTSRYCITTLLVDGFLEQLSL